MKKRKNEFRENQNFNYTELTALCEHLEIREREGKKLRRIDKYELTYDITEPRDIRYSAVIFNKVLMHKDFVATCEQEGWEYVGSHNELYVFRTQNPDATEIMTDESDYFKIVAKSYLKHPRFLGVNGFLFYILVSRFFDLFTYNSTIAAKGFLMVDYLFLVVFLISIVFKITEYIEWYKKAKNAVRNNEKIPFANYKERTTKKISRVIVYCFFGIAILCFWIYTSWGYIPTDWVLYVNLILLGLITVTSLYDYVKIISRKKALVLTFISILIFVAGAYFLTVNLDTAYNENPNILKEENIPVSVSDLKSNACWCENEIDDYSGTKFAQYYEIRSYCSMHEESIYYDIFISDNEKIKRNYIDKIIEDETTDDTSIVSYNPENSGWDEQYRLIYNDEITNYGFAVKGNTVIYLHTHTLDIDKDTNFFDVAYNKLFG